MPERPDIVHPLAENLRTSTGHAETQRTNEHIDGDILVHLARLALTGVDQDIITYIRRQAHRLRNRCPQTARALDALTPHLPPPSPLRDSQTFPPHGPHAVPESEQGVKNP